MKTEQEVNSTTLFLNILSHLLPKRTIIGHCELRKYSVFLSSQVVIFSLYLCQYMLKCQPSHLHSDGTRQY